MADAEKKKSLTAKRTGHNSYAMKCTNAAKLLLESKDGENRVKLTTYLKILSERKDIIAGLDNEILDVWIQANMKPTSSPAAIINCH